jgi:hypothetical protein
MQVRMEPDGRKAGMELEHSADPARSATETTSRRALSQPNWPKPFKTAGSHTCEPPAHYFYIWTAVFLGNIQMAHAVQNTAP